MNTTPTVTLTHCHLLDTGYCLAHESTMIQGGRREQVACHALVALLHHPNHGWMLWDTGYAPRMLTETARLPYRFYRWATPLRLDPAVAVAAQLDRFGLQPSSIKLIIISHFHADHIAGLRDFPTARFVATQAAYDHFVARTGWAALRCGYLPALLPSDFAERATLLPAFTGPDVPFLGASQDLFGDGSLRLVNLPGHARGQIGLLAHTAQGDNFFVADGAWLRRAIHEARPPARATRLIVDDWAAVQRTLANLHAFAQAYPTWRLIPTHCPEVFAHAVEPSR
ncbi:MAG: MBL fold metallo-hydrolase [Caldilineaceae bacterium]